MRAASFLLRQPASLALAVLLQGLIACPALACNVSVGSLSFGPYNPLARSASVTTSGTITVVCDSTPPPNVTVMIGPSIHSGGFHPRRMRHSGSMDTLEYNLYVDTSASIVWADGRPGTGARTDRVFRGRPWTMTVYARVPPGQDVTPGSYSDNIGISIIF